jgi:hypothetical protein
MRHLTLPAGLNASSLPSRIPGNLSPLGDTLSFGKRTKGVAPIASVIAP